MIYESKIKNLKMYLSYYDKFKLYLLTKAIVKKLPIDQIRYAPRFLVWLDDC